VVHQAAWIPPSRRAGNSPRRGRGVFFAALLGAALVLLAGRPAIAANCDLLQSTSKGNRYKMLDGQTGVGDGCWIDVRGFRGAKTFAVQGIGTGTVTVQCSNGTTAGAIPAAATDGTTMGGSVTTNSVVTVLDACSFVKVEKTVAGDSTATTVILDARVAE
jgi:hypothetical protein